MQTVRSIYLIQKRTVRVPWLETFDLPENSVSCPQRETSIVPSQALTLLNAELTLDAAEQLAKSLFDLEAREAIDQLFDGSFRGRRVQKKESCRKPSWLGAPIPNVL